MRLVGSGTVSSATVVHVDDIVSVGRTATGRCDQFCQDLNRLGPINNLGELRQYAGCRYSRVWDVGTLTISQQDLAETRAAKFGVSSGRRKGETCVQKASKSMSLMRLNLGRLVFS